MSTYPYQVRQDSDRCPFVAASGTGFEPELSCCPYLLYLALVLRLRLRLSL